MKRQDERPDASCCWYYLKNDIISNVSILTILFYNIYAPVKF
jgi:hypothetical protein